MGRHWYTAASYAAAVERIARRQAVFGLGADVIAGFPGEDDADHRATMDLVRALPFTSLHVFPYSPRPGTAAERLPSRVHGAVVTRRASELRALGEAKAAEHRARRAGGSADVVVVGVAPRRAGLTQDNLAVAIVGASPPRRARVRATLETAGGELVARVVPV
jgi:threonylcarbamoyladenosine tRNA methylthiotransferase MtaB